MGNSRISLELLIEQYENGMTPEEMVHAYDSLQLGDVHAVIAYYLRHGDELQPYLNRRDAESKVLRDWIEPKHPPVSRDELLARRPEVKATDAPAGQ